MKKLYIKTLLVAIFVLGFKAMNSQCTAGFAFTNGTGGNVTFTSTSVGTNSNTMYYWAYGDGFSNTFSTTNASHNYASNGVYTVTLTIYDSLFTCYSVAALNLTVTNAPCTGSANFSSSLNPGGLVNFNCTTSLSGWTHFWDFGDGNSVNSGTNPATAHTYTASGNYNVTLVATDPLSICSYTVVKSTSVTVASCSLVANFTFTNGAAGLVNFSSTSTGTTANTSYFWNFGDGNYGYSGPTISHTYSTNAVFSVSLTVIDSTFFFCYDDAAQSVTIANVPCIANSNFTVAKDSSLAFTWDAIPAYPSNIVAANWSWGDATSTTGLYPSHTYSAAGFYTICLSVTVSCTSGPLSSTTCVNTNIYRINANDQTAAMITVNVKNITTGINSFKDESLIYNIYPNPNNGNVSLQISNSPLKEVDIFVYNMIGENVYKSTVVPINGTVKTNLDLNELANGTYFIRVEGQNTSKKLIILK